MNKIIASIKSRGVILFVYLANLFLSFHYYFTAYVNSSFLADFFNPRNISLFFIVAATVEILLHVKIPSIMNLIGNRRFALVISIINIFATLTLATSNNHSLIAVSFVLMLVGASTLGYCLDIFLEHCTKEEGYTGELRGVFLTIANIALVLTSLFLSTLNLGENNFRSVYFLSFMCLVPLIMIVFSVLKDYKDPEYQNHRFADALYSLFHDVSLRAVMISNFLLQLFYSWMVIYMSVHLTKDIGLSWNQFASMMAIVLLPFPLFELLVGVLADHLFGEKEMMGLGLLLMGGFLILASLVNQPILIILTSLLFMTRVGAVMVEMTTESFFFKKVKDNDADLISIFRLTRPFAYIVGPLLGIPLFYFLPTTWAFMTLGVIIASGSIMTRKIMDTR